MKRLLVFTIILALLCTACATQTEQSANPSSAALPTAVSPASQASAKADSEDFAALADPSDETKAATDAFAITSESGAVEPDGSLGVFFHQRAVNVPFSAI